MLKYLPLLIASTLFVTACSKEKAPKENQESNKAVAQVQENEEYASTPATTESQTAQAIKQEIQDAPILMQKQPEVSQPQPQATSNSTTPQGASTVASTNKTCHATTDSEIAALFDRWNAGLKTGKADIVISNYAPDSILLPTVSNKIYHSVAEKKDYFEHFLTKAPISEINERYIKIGCNSAIDTGIYTFHYGTTDESVTGRYTFTYEWNGNKWLITSHHSSLMPEKVSSETLTATPSVAVH